MLVLVTAFLVIEVVAAFLTNSLALLADAGHMFTDAAGIGLVGFLTVLVRSSWDHRSMTVSINNLTVDCRDPRALADFWTAALGWVVVDESDEGVMIAPFSERHPGVFPVYFQENPDDKVVKNRWHFDLAPVDQDAEVTRLKALGARDADIGQGDVPWVVMADVEGNEFCVLRSLPKEAAG